VKLPLPETLRVDLRYRRDLWRYGYSAEFVDPWAKSLGADSRTGRRWAHACMRLENEPHFRPGLFGALWPGLDRDRALAAAADSCYWGVLAERAWLGGWGRSDDDASEALMVRYLNQSLRHAVEFCVGWSEAFLHGTYKGDVMLAGLAEGLKECPGRVLDLGAGGMPLFPVYRDREWVASDLNLNALRVMKHVLALPSERLVCHDAQSIPFPSSSFDVVLCRYVIENIRRPLRMLSEVFRILTPGGTFLLCVPGSLFVPGGRYYTNREFFPDRPQFEAMLERTGFRHAYDAPSGVYRLRKEGRGGGVVTPLFTEPESEGGRTVQPAVRVDGIPVLVPPRFLWPEPGKLPPSSAFRP